MSFEERFRTSSINHKMRKIKLFFVLISYFVEAKWERCKNGKSNVQTERYYMQNGHKSEAENSKILTKFHLDKSSTIMTELKFDV